jgi:hypothetical protein
MRPARTTRLSSGELHCSRDSGASDLATKEPARRTAGARGRDTRLPPGLGAGDHSPQSINGIGSPQAALAKITDELAQLVRKDQDLAAKAERLDKSIIAAVSKLPAELLSEDAPMRLARASTTCGTVFYIFDLRTGSASLDFLSCSGRLQKNV